jgi:hypothetical protein
MQNLCFWTECTVSGTEVVKHPFYSIGPKLMLSSVSKHVANLQQVKDVNIASEPECTISRYQSREASPWTQIEVSDCFGAFL